MSMFIPTSPPGKNFLPSFLQLSKPLISANIMLGLVSLGIVGFIIYLFYCTSQSKKGWGTFIFDWYFGSDKAKHFAAVLAITLGAFLGTFWLTQDSYGSLLVSMLVAAAVSIFREVYDISPCKQSGNNFASFMDLAFDLLGFLVAYIIILLAFKYLSFFNANPGYIPVYNNEQWILDEKPLSGKPLFELKKMK